MTIKVERLLQDQTCEDISNNNQDHQPTQGAAVSANSSLDSVVQRLIDKKMGRRKQNCPQRTGISEHEGKRPLCESTQRVTQLILLQSIES